MSIIPLTCAAWVGVAGRTADSIRPGITYVHAFADGIGVRRCRTTLATGDRWLPVLKVIHMSEKQPGDDVYRGRIDHDTSPSTAIVEAIASMEGLDPTQMDSRLYDSVDPSGLNAVLSTPAGAEHEPCPLTVSFTHAGYEVTVSRSGRFRIAPVGAD